MNAPHDAKGVASEVPTCPFCGKPMPPDRTKCPSCGFDSVSWNPKEISSPEAEEAKKHRIRAIRMLTAVVVILFLAVVLRFLKVI